HQPGKDRAGKFGGHGNLYLPRKRTTRGRDPTRPTPERLLPCRACPGGFSPAGPAATHFLLRLRGRRGYTNHVATRKEQFFGPLVGSRFRRARMDAVNRVRNCFKKGQTLFETVSYPRCCRRASALDGKPHAARMRSVSTMTESSTAA